MHKPIYQRPPSSPAKAAAPAPKSGSSTQPLDKTTANKPDAFQGPGKAGRQAQPSSTKDPIVTAPRAAQGDDDLMSQEPKKS